jgi:hypothetical protein
MKVNQALFDKIIELFEAADLEPRSYSGRGMSGSTCLGCSYDDNCVDIVIDIFDIILSNVIDFDDSFDEDVYKILTALRGSKTDSLGRGSIIYWPRIPWLK